MSGKLGVRTLAQVFTPHTISEVTSGTPLTPPLNAVAFRVPSAVSYFMGASGTFVGSGQLATLVAGSVTGVTSGQTYTFNGDFFIELA